MSDIKETNDMDHKNNFNESYDFEDIVTWSKEMIEVTNVLK